MGEKKAEKMDKKTIWELTNYFRMKSGANVSNIEEVNNLE